MKPTLIPGVRGEVRQRVQTAHLVSHYNPGGPAVLASPMMLWIMEHAAYDAMQPHLDEGEQSVGVGFEFEHLAPTPAGMVVTGTAEVLEVTDNFVRLSIEAHDGHELVGRGTHTRAVIDLARFKKRLEKKRGA